MIEDLKEIAPCGMKIMYTVDTSTNFITYNDINGRGKLSEECSRCSWRCICKPIENKQKSLEKLESLAKPIMGYLEAFNPYISVVITTDGVRVVQTTSFTPKKESVLPDADVERI